MGLRYAKHCMIEWSVKLYLHFLKIWVSLRKILLDNDFREIGIWVTHAVGRSDRITGKC